MCMKRAVIKYERSEEEKRRRRFHGDRGARFKGGKVPIFDWGGVIGTITTLVTKDILIIEIYELDKEGL